MQKKYILSPGSRTTPEDVSLEMTLPMQQHRTPQCRKIFGEAAERTKYLFQTKQDVLIFAATETAGDIL